jgi:hypothetical protein
MLDHMGLEQLAPKAMERRLKGHGDGNKAGEEGRQTSSAEVLRHLRAQPQPATQVNPRCQG